MFLKEIRLRNFRCFDDLTISFVKEGGGTRKWTILLGENGSGKSNLLKGIALIPVGSDAIPELLGGPTSGSNTKSSSVNSKPSS